MKIIKRIAAAALIAVLAVSLTSCLALDEAREHQMFWSDDGRYGIIYKGNKYVGFEVRDYTTANLLVGAQGGYHITDKDVPVLLAERRGLYAEYDSEMDVIRAAGYTMYFREEKYEEYKKAFTAPKTDSLAVIKSVEHKEENGDGLWFENKLVKLDDDLTVGIKEAIAGEKVSAEINELLNMGSDQIMEIFCVTDDVKIVKNDFYGVVRYKDECYLRVGGDYYKLSDGIMKALEKEYTDSFNVFPQYGYDFYEAVYPER